MDGKFLSDAFSLFFNAHFDVRKQNGFCGI
jgi:hypothetical protein